MAGKDKVHGRDRLTQYTWVHVSEHGLCTVSGEGCINNSVRTQNTFFRDNCIWNQSRYFNYKACQNRAEPKQFSPLHEKTLWLCTHSTYIFIVSIFYSQTVSVWDKQ